MASSYSPNLGIELIAPGEQDGSWGATTNRNLGTLLEQAIAGLVRVVLIDADVTLSSTVGVSNQARNAILIIEGAATATRDIIIPTIGIHSYDWHFSSAAVTTGNQTCYSSQTNRACVSDRTSSKRCSHRNRGYRTRRSSLITGNHERICTVAEDVHRYTGGYGHRCTCGSFYPYALISDRISDYVQF